MKKTIFLERKILVLNVKLTMLLFVVFTSFSFALSSNITSEDFKVLDFPVNLNEFQGIEIKGTVSDADGPIPGVNVLVRGTTTGTQTDFDGNYSLTVENSDAVLAFSYAGYATQEIVVGNQTTINVLLQTDTSVLNEVVVVGYSTKKRGEITGSISTLKAEEIENTSNREIAKSLAGRVTGLIVSDRGGLPGSNDDVTLLIRG